MSEFQHITKATETVYRLGEPVIRARAEAMASLDFERPDDLMQWLLDANPPKNKDDIREQLKCQLMTSLASIHASSMALTQVIYGRSAL